MPRRLQRLLHALREEVEGHAAEVDAIARRTKMLALNVGIEAARVGLDGRAFSVVAQEVKGLAAEVGVSSAAFREGVLRRLETGWTIADELLSDIEGSRLVALAETIAMHITRTVYSRRPHLTLLATDAAIVSVLRDPTPVRIEEAAGRLGLFLRTTGQYVSAVVATDRGEPVVEVGATTAGRGAHDAAFLRDAMGMVGEEEWCAGGIGRVDGSEIVVLHLAKAVLAPGTGSPIGVLLLDFDWSQLMDELLLGRVDVRDADRRTRLTVVDRGGLCIGSSWGLPFGQRVNLPDGSSEGLAIEGDLVRAFAAECPFHGFPGLGIRCLIEHLSPSP